MSIDDVLCSLITGGEVGVVVGEEFQVGVQLMYELFGQGLEGVYSVLSDCNFKGVREDQDGMIRWGGGRSEVVGMVGLVSSVPSSLSRLHTWLVGVGQIVHPAVLQGEFLVHLVKSILVERSIWIHLEVVLYICQEL